MSIARIVNSSAGYISEKAKQAHTELVQTVFAVIALVLIMFGFNIAGLMKVNFIFFFAGLLYVVLKATSPSLLWKVGVLGAGVEALRDNDITQGSMKGLVVLYRITLGFLLFYLMMAGVLATWSFEPNPMAFFNICAGGLIASTAIAFFNMKGSLLKYATLGYAIYISGMAFYSTMSPESWIRKQFEGKGQVEVVAVSERKLVVTREWSKPIILPFGECIAWHGDDIATDNFDTVVMGPNSTRWYSWEEWTSLKKQGVIRDEFMYTRFKAKGESANVFFRFGNATSKECGKY